MREDPEPFFGHRGEHVLGNLSWADREGVDHRLYFVVTRPRLRVRIRVAKTRRAIARVRTILAEKARQA